MSSNTGIWLLLAGVLSIVSQDSRQGVGTSLFPHVRREAKLEVVPKIQYTILAALASWRNESQSPGLDLRTMSCI